MTAETRSILLVEDELLLCWVLEETLREGSRFDVTIATTGDEGMAAIEGSRHFDVLVTNIRLKNGPDGWALARRARELDPEIAVLFVSGDSAAQHPTEGVPGSAMLSKPFENDQILAVIDRLLAAKARGSAAGPA